MPCYSPLHGYRSNKLSVNGKRQIVFKRDQGFVDQVMIVPCGACIGCRIDRSREWALRCVHESKMHDRSCFITLTYEDSKMPDGGTLVKKDLQDFFKRLRKQLGPFRYFACGEYGEKTYRPHYHAVLFGQDFREDRKLHNRNSQGNTLYKSDILQTVWGHGHCLVGAFSYANAAYTARYVMKKQTGKNAADSDLYTRLAPDTGELYQVSPEFACMSLRPGLGSSWFDKYKSDAFPSDFLVVNGKKHPVPRFYVTKLKEENPLEYDLIKRKRKLARDNDMQNSTSDRLFTRMEVKKSKLSQLKRSL